MSCFPTADVCGGVLAQLWGRCPHSQGGGGSQLGEEGSMLCLTECHCRLAHPQVTLQPLGTSWPATPASGLSAIAG